MPSSKAKGKARADPPSERSPLLPQQHPSSSSSSSSAVAPPDDVTRALSRRRAVLICIVSACLFFVVGIIALLAASFQPSEREIRDLPDSFKYTSPVVHILDIGDSGVHINVSFNGGVDVDEALAIDGRRGSSVWQSFRRGAAHSFFGALPQQEVRVTVPAMQVYARGGGLPLLNVSLPGEIVVPLVRDGQLRPITIDALGAPVAPVGEIWAWAQAAWAEGNTEVVVGLPQVRASLPGWWSRWATFTQADLAFPLQFDGMSLLPAPSMLRLVPRMFEF